MKKSALKLVALILVLVCVGTVFASCGKTLSGTYSASALGLAGTSYEFKGSKVTISVSLLGSVTEFEGKYSIDDGKITFTFEDEDAEEYSGTQTFEELDNGDIKIGVITYEKKD
jgi:hypothetical protein